jgi:hypothetical protein
MGKFWGNGKDVLDAGRALIPTARTVLFFPKSIEKQVIAMSWPKQEFCIEVKTKNEKYELVVQIIETDSVKFSERVLSTFNSKEDAEEGLALLHQRISHSKGKKTLKRLFYVIATVAVITFCLSAIKALSTDQNQAPQQQTEKVSSSSGYFNPQVRQTQTASIPEYTNVEQSSAAGSFVSPEDTMNNYAQQALAGMSGDNQKKQQALADAFRKNNGTQDESGQPSGNSVNDAFRDAK